MANQRIVARMTGFVLLAFGLIWTNSPALAAGLRAGVGRVVITPRTPIWLSGYAARTQPATEVLHDLWAKALVLDDGMGGRVVIVTTDLIGLPRQISEAAASRIQSKYGLKRSQLLFNSSHTHTGPALRPNLSVIYDWTAEWEERRNAYSSQLTENLVRVVGNALDSLAPAEIHVGRDRADFAVNRRERAPQGFRIGVNKDGPVDHEVPVLQVTGQDGTVRALLFGYACHNTTLTAGTLALSGDYAGFAQRELERRHPGATAMFMLLCGADQNPNPRGKVEYAQAHGRQLADAVDSACRRMRPIKTRIRTTFTELKLPFVEHSRRTFEEEIKETDPFRQRRARLMLQEYDRGRPVRFLPYPVQAIGLDDRFAILALAGEVVVDYSIRAKREYPGLELLVAGYSNEVPCYIASDRVLREGGYEASESMIYCGQPGPLRTGVEERVFKGIREVLSKAGFKR